MSTTRVPGSELPGSEVAQHMAALERGNAIRLARVAVKREIAGLSRQDGLLRVADLVEAQPDDLDGMRCTQLIEAVYRMGPLAAVRLLGAVGVPERATVGVLTPRWRAALAGALRVTAHDLTGRAAA